MHSTSSPVTKSVMERHFALKAPCGNCPFRIHGAIELELGRLEGIVQDLVKNDCSTFQCHKTVHLKATGGDWDDDGNYVASGKEAMCVGAMIYLEKLGRPTDGMRIARIRGVYNPHQFEKLHSQIIDAVGHSHHVKIKIS